MPQGLAGRGPWPALQGTHLAVRIFANTAQQARGRQGSLATLLETAAAIQALMHTTEAHRGAVEAFSKR